MNSILQGLTAQGITLLEDQFKSQSDTAREATPKDDIAIVGMSGRFPGGSNLEEFWKTLEEGKDLHAQVRKN